MLRTFSLDRREQYEAYFRRPVKKHTDRRESSTPPFILADLRLLTPFIILLQGGLLAAVFVLPEPQGQVSSRPAFFALILGIA